jgi:hypothetical protein
MGKPLGTLMLPTKLRQERRRLEIEDEFEMTLLPWQVSKQPNKDYDELSLEGQIAYKKLMRDILDVTAVENKEKRLRYIAEMYQWINNDARRAKTFPGDEGFEYTFEYWCEQLDVDEGYMRRKLREFLRNATKEVKIET